MEVRGERNQISADQTPKNHTGLSAADQTPPKNQISDIEQSDIGPL